MKKGNPSLRKKVKTILVPFLKDGIKGLDSFEVLESVLPTEVAEVYKEVEATGKWRYFFLKRRCAKFLDHVSDHNEDVLNIRQELNSFSLKDLYNRPDLVTDKTIKDIVSWTDRAWEYRISSTNPYRQKVEGLRIFVTKLNAIRKQWPFWHSLRSILKTIENDKDFIPRSKWQEYLDKEIEVWKEIASLKPRFYDFDSLPSVGATLRSHNTEWLKKASANPLFDDIGGVSLDISQRMAAISPERNALVIAGAGSGKTTTICGRVKYLLEVKKVDPKEILLLSFSKKSADDLAQKMERIHPELTVGTFHKIGLDILKKKTAKQFVVEEQWDAIIEAYFRDEVVKKPDALRNILIYYGLYLNNGETSKKYATEGEWFEDLKKENFITFKESLLSLSSNPMARETIKKERVKSFEEMAIANFYFINGVDYEYERPYEYDVSTPQKRQYIPDFYLKDYGIYHEHFGIGADGRAKQFDGKAEREYIQGRAWKKACHLSYKTRLIETLSADFEDGTVFEKLKDSLTKAGVRFHPLSNDAIKEALDSVYGGKSFKSFINLVKSFLSLYKARYEDASMFAQLKNTSFSSGYAKTRANLFLDICEDVYRFYMNRIRSEGKIDFDDMILQSTKALPEIEGFRFHHVIIDEFQDISHSRMLFLKQILAKGDASLFAVGDDWQSIYRFNGCDIGIFLNFEEYFGTAERYFIGNVHRNSQQLQDAMTRFIEQNPEQIQKTIKAKKSLQQPIQVIYYDDEEYTALKQAFGIISKMNPLAKVLLLGRNNKDIAPYLNHRFYQEKPSGALRCLDFPHLTISFSTVHASKGLEEDYVILLSAEDSPNGFPNKTEDDPILNLVMSPRSWYPYAEERRLWYVALTRTRSYAFILAPKRNPSFFLQEMQGDVFIVNPEEQECDESQIKCPRCKAGHLVLREKDGKRFYGCSNFPFCRYSMDDFRAVERGLRCPICGDYLVYHKGKWGPFYGCHNYPRCDYTQKYEAKK